MQANVIAPILFESIYVERLWGGRQLETRFGRPLPAGKCIGEIWELVDRPEAQSAVRNEPFYGLTLNDLWINAREQIFGPIYLGMPDRRFPILIKLLDAREKLSVQVHPPPEVACSLDGEPKTEMWYFLDADLDASVYAGLKSGVTRNQVEEQLRSGNIESALHKIHVGSGQTMFIPSGRLHAIGKGNIIVEIQQNSDTTYRIFDWNRTTADGKRRKLHIKESLASINFSDYEPQPHAIPHGTLVECPYFKVEKQTIDRTQTRELNKRFVIICVVKGKANIAGLALDTAKLCLIPAALEKITLTPVSDSAELLIITLPVENSNYEKV